MLYTRKDLRKLYPGVRIPDQPLEKFYVQTKAKLAELCAGETLAFKNYKGNSYHCYYVNLVSDDFLWWYPDNWKEGDPLTHTWAYLGVEIWLPVAKKLLNVLFSKCINFFAKPQQCNILSWIVDKAK